MEIQGTVALSAASTLDFTVRPGRLRINDRGDFEYESADEEIRIRGYKSLWYSQTANREWVVMGEALDVHDDTLLGALIGLMPERISDVPVLLDSPKVSPFDDEWIDEAKLFARAGPNGSVVVNARTRDGELTYQISELDHFEVRLPDEPG